MKEYVGQCFQVELAADYGCVGFKGKVISVNEDFVVFSTDNGPFIVNIRYIKTLTPRKDEK
jgi:hypothetical protein